MYIHKMYSIQNKNTSIKDYKTQLKEISSINLRRSNKFNILALLGSLRCMKNITFSSNIGIYVSSEYGPISSLKKVLNQVNTDNFVMPFDFLNINSNNVSFYVSQALNAKGKNMTLTSKELSFEKLFEVSLFELEIDEVNDILIGYIEESIEEINNFHKYINKTKDYKTYDHSSWIYINKIKENALAIINN